MKRWFCTAPIAFFALLVCGLGLDTRALAQRSATAVVRDSRVTSPRSFLGFTPGDTERLANYTQSLAYFRTIAGQTRRMKLLSVGSTANGQPMILAVISSERNLARLDRLKSIARTLADGRVSESEASKLAGEGLPFVWIDGGMHATEVGCAQHTINLGYDMVSRDDALYRRLREKCVLLLVPSINPDGQNLVADWFNLHHGTLSEGTPLPALYQKYSGHDNNRDWYMLNLVETRNMTRLLYDDFFPQIVYNHHQSAPFPARIFVPPYAEPLNPNTPPLVVRGINSIGAAMHTRFEEEGKTGVISEATYTAWWNGGMRSTPFFHNTIGILTETAHASPYTVEYRVPAARQEPNVWYPNPYKGGVWRFADTVEYMNTGSIAVLNYAADHGGEVLLNRWRMASRAIAAGNSEAPYGFIIPLDPALQRDPNTAALMVERLRLSGIEVQAASAPISVEGTTYPAGTLVLLASQANRPHLMDMLTPQRHPMRLQYPGGPPVKPYDIAGWTLSLQMGVAAIPLNQPPGAWAKTLRPQTTQVLLHLPAIPDGEVGGGWTLPANRNVSFTAVNRLLARGVPIFRLGAASGDSPVGTFFVPTSPAAQSAVGEIAMQLRLQPTAIPRDLRALPTTFALRPTRVATYDPYGGNMVQGWTQLVLETFAFDHRTIANPDLREGNLNASVDALILNAYPNVRDRTVRAGDDDPAGLGPGFLGGPAPKQLPPDVAARMNGIGAAGEANLRKFVRDGGTLIATDRAANAVAALFALPVKEVARGTKFYSPGSVFAANVQPDSPLGAGLPAQISVFFNDGPVWELTDSSIRPALLYPDTNPLRSGWIVADEAIRGKVAVVSFAVGRGRVVLFGCDIINRGQPHEGFPLLFNAVLGVGR